MAAVTKGSDFGAPPNKVCQCPVFPSICHEVRGPDAMILVSTCLLLFCQDHELFACHWFNQQQLC